MAGTVEVARFTQNIPHPYENGMAEAWIGTHQEQFASGRQVVFAVILRESGDLVGCVGLGRNAHDENGEIGYWFGVPFWGRGYCTEAARAVLRFGFTVWKLHRIHSRHFANNPASGRVMQKIGMTHEGCQRQHVRKWDEWIDIELYGILREDWESRAAA